VRFTLDRLTLGRQFGLLAAGCCLLVSLALIGLSAVSSDHTRELQQRAFGDALALQLAHSVGGALEIGDLLGVAAMLQQFVDMTLAEEAEVRDVEGKLLGRAGSPPPATAREYRAPVLVAEDLAGEVAVTMVADTTAGVRRRLLLSLSGLAVLLSVAVFGAAHFFGQRLSARLGLLAQQISLEDAAEDNAETSAVAQLEKRVEQLPMDLLRTRSSGQPRDENYRTTAVLYLHLTSLAAYVDTLDEDSLTRYTRRLHRVIYAAAGFYAGELHVARQFGLTLYFSGDNSTGSAAFRAASCAWLVRGACRELEQQMPLSLTVAMAVGQSELGAGDGHDIYPGLYIQHTVDELQQLCAMRPPQILLSPAACDDDDVNGRLLLHPSELRDYSMLDSFAEPYHDLLERQLRLILRRISGSAAA
jgi:hypothetical protein